MKYKTEKTKSGLKVFKNDVHIKTIPAKFKTVVSRIAFSSKKKRLSDQERLHLEGELVKDTLSTQPPPEKYIYERIKNAIAIDCVMIKRRDASPRYELLFNNNDRIKCSSSLHRMGNKVEEFKLY